MRTRARHVLSLVLGTSLLSAAAVHADTCDDDYVAAQKAEKSGALISARDHYKACAQGSCPMSEQKDCTLGFASISPRVPTVLVTVSFGGAPIASVTVTMDGKPIPFDGKALEVDPGKHSFHFVLADGRSKDIDAIVVEGTRGQPIKAEFEAPKDTGADAAVSTTAGSSPPTGSSDVSPATTSGGWSTQKYLALGVAGVGVLGIIVGGIEGARAHSAWNDSKSECASPTSCSSHDQAVADHDTAQSAATISTVGFVVGGAALVGGALWFFLTPSTSSSSTTSDTGSLRVLPSVGPGGVSAALTGRF